MGSVPAGAAAESDALVDHKFLRCVLDILRAAAELKDADEVRWAGCLCDTPFATPSCVTRRRALK